MSLVSGILKTCACSTHEQSLDRGLQCVLAAQPHVTATIPVFVHVQIARVNEAMAGMRAALGDRIELVVDVKKAGSQGCKVRPSKHSLPLPHESNYNNNNNKMIIVILSY